MYDSRKAIKQSIYSYDISFFFIVLSYGLSKKFGPIWLVGGAGVILLVQIGVWPYAKVWNRESRVLRFLNIFTLPMCYCLLEFVIPPGNLIFRMAVLTVVIYSHYFLWSKEFNSERLCSATLDYAKEVSYTKVTPFSLRYFAGVWRDVRYFGKLYIRKESRRVLCLSFDKYIESLEYRCSEDTAMWQSIRRGEIPKSVKYSEKVPIEDIINKIELGNSKPRVLANQNNATELYRIGLAYDNYSCFEAKRIAARYYRRALKFDHADAAYRLGEMLLFGEGTERSLFEAKSVLVKAADLGHGGAQYLLALLHKYGADYQALIEVDEDLSLEYMKASASQGYPLACTNIAVSYLTNNSDEAKESEAHRLLTLAAGQGDSVARFNLLLLAEKNKQPSIQNEIIKQSEQGEFLADNEIKFFIAWQAYKGNVVEKDQVKAIRLFRELADSGHIASQIISGYMLLNGVGVQQNTELAINYFQQAAKAKDETALCVLGWLYADGKLVAKNYDKAAKYWYDAVCATDSGQAMFNLSLLYLQRGFAKKNYSKAYAWADAARERGYKYAENHTKALAHRLTKREIDSFKHLLFLQYLTLLSCKPYDLDSKYNWFL